MKTDLRQGKNCSKVQKNTCDGTGKHSSLQKK